MLCVQLFFVSSERKHSHFPIWRFHNFGGTQFVDGWTFMNHVDFIAQRGSKNVRCSVGLVQYILFKLVPCILWIRLETWSQCLNRNNHPSKREREREKRISIVHDGPKIITGYISPKSRIEFVSCPACHSELARVDPDEADKYEQKQISNAQWWLFCLSGWLASD